MGDWLPSWLNDPLEDVYRAITSPPGDPQIILSPDEKSELAQAIDEIVPFLDRTVKQGQDALQEIKDGINFMGDSRGVGTLTLLAGGILAYAILRD